MGREMFFAISSLPARLWTLKNEVTSPTPAAKPRRGRLNVPTADLSAPAGFPEYLVKSHHPDETTSLAYFSSNNRQTRRPERNR